jgi:hypothetical protein
LLAGTILEGQHTAWSLCRRLILECLKRNRRITRNFMRGKPPPPYRPMYATIDTYKATFPPSQASYNAALAYLRTGFAVDAITFSTRAPSLSLSRAQFPHVWIAVLALHSRHGEAAVHLLDTLKDQGKQHPMFIEFRPEDALRRKPAEKLIRTVPSQRAKTPSGANVVRPSHLPRMQEAKADGCRVLTPGRITRHGAFHALPTTSSTLRSSSLLLLSPRLTLAEDRTVDEMFQGVRPLPPDVPFRCELSPQGRFHDIRCLQPGQWLIHCCG